MATISEALAMGGKYYLAGEFANAELIYRQILEAEPHQVGVWHLRGLACQALGNLAEALACLQQAVRLAPDHFDSYHSLGHLFPTLGRLDEASAAWRHYLRLRPDSIEGYASLALILRRQGRNDEAVAAYQRILRLKPDCAEAHNDIGNVFQELGRLDEAVACYRQALRLDPNLAEGHHNLGASLAAKGNTQEALRHYQLALRANPEKMESCTNLGIVNLGNSLRDSGRLNEAADCFQQAIDMNPAFAEGHCKLGSVLHAQGKLEEALASFERALHLKADYAEAQNNVGIVLHELGRLDEALVAYDQALRLQPEHVEARHNRGILHLLLGNFEEGLPECEWRWMLKNRVLPVLPRFSQPAWDGSPLMRRTILLYQDWGLGDMLQFIRYAPLVQQRGGRVLVTCDKSLIPLLASCTGIDELVALGLPLPNFDVYAMVESLPCLFRTVLSTIPANVPYLYADPERLKRWRQELGPVRAFKIGIAWQGSPKRSRDRYRSVRLAQFAPLGKVEGVRLFSLQKGPGVDQLAEMAATFQVTDLGSQLENFADTAALMKSLDLVVTVDSAVAHCAGALGTPVWVVLWSPPEWRWLLEREDSPWYPTMRLFRQKRRGDWDEVFQRMAEELRTVVRQDRVYP